MTTERLTSSFRDPSGFLFTRDGILYRQVNQCYALEYSRLVSSGLSQNLVKAGLLVPHEEVSIEPLDKETAFRVIQPERLPFISYPYEWSFSQYREAALATLGIQKRALKAGFSLKDASAYNIQFLRGKAALIDSLSFEIYQEGEPWVAYRQFCQHFLAPLALMAKVDIRLGQLMRVHIDGIPLDLASKLLPKRTYWNLSLYAHIHLHAKAQQKYAEVAVRDARAGRTISKDALLSLISSLENAIRKLKWKSGKTEWGDYYDATNYTEIGFEFKQKQVREWVGRIRPRVTWDLGANNGLFSRIAAQADGYVVAFDIDPKAVDQNWKQAKKDKETNLLPLAMDLTNPSPALGWDHAERNSLVARGPAGLILSLALLHHLAISNNLPFDRIAAHFSRLGEWLIIEFVPKTDSQVQRLLRSRKDIFMEYDRAAFESSFGAYFELVDAQPVPESARWLYLMRKRTKQ